MVIQHELDEASVLQEMTMTHAVNWLMLGKVEWLKSLMLHDFLLFPKTFDFYEARTYQANSRCS